MKKIFIFICLILFMTSCSNNVARNEQKKVTTTTTTTTTKISYKDDNPINLGFYLYTNSYTNRKLIDVYTKVWENEIDIGSFEVFYTTENEISGSTFQTIWNNYYNNYSIDLNKYKIGYHIKFSMEDGTIVDKNILNPVDAESLYNYVQIYLYDDIHQEIGAWYSHVTPEEYNDNTKLTSIKLTNSNFTKQINSDIILTVFTYDDDDFDENGNYRGNSRYSITIKRK